MSATPWDLTACKDFPKAVAKAMLSHAARTWLRRGQRRGAIVYRRIARRLRDTSMRFANREGLRNFDFRLFERRDGVGVSALLRVKNEETKLYYCLRSIFEAFDEIVFVDNGSEDNSLGIAREFKRQYDRRDKIRIYAYPFKVSRCGAEHRNTPADSVHSLSYFYNWCLAQCSCRYVCKWDGDMILRKQSRGAFKALVRRIQHAEECWVLPGQTVYRDPAGAYYLAKHENSREARLFPYGFNPRFYKSELYEVLRADPALPVETFADVCFYELKFAEEDEFANVSTADFPSLRKTTERESLEMLRAGRAPEGRFERLPRDFLDAEVG